MDILLIYLLGIAAYLIFIVWFNYQFDHNNDLRNVTTKEWKQDLMLALFSWLSVLLGIVITIWRFNGGKPA